MQPKIEVLDVSKEMASQWLEHNDHNRPIDWRICALYQRQMEEGTWRFVGDPIRRSVTGRLLDGQNRLTALVLAQDVESLPFVVISGLADEDQPYMDVGKRRTAGDVFAMNGVPNARKAASVAAMLMTYERGQLFNSKHQLTNAEVLAYYQDPANSRLIDDGAAMGAKVRIALPINPSVAGSIWVAASRISDPFAVNFFFERLVYGHHLSEDSPVAALRNWVLRRKREDLRVSRNDHFFLLTKAWNAWVEKEPVYRMQLPQGGVSSARQLPKLLPAGPLEEAETSEDNPAVTPYSRTRKEREAAKVS